MKLRRLGRLLPALLIVFSLCAAMIPAGGSTTSVYLMSVNDTVKPDLTADNMPLMFNGELYIPYTMLSSQHTGINLGVRVQYSPVTSVLNVTDDIRSVSFNTRKNTAHASTGSVVQARAVMRNSMPYIPVDWLCSFFSSLNYSLIQTPYGTLVRLTNKQVILDDDEFVDAAAPMLYNSLQNYRQSLVTPEPTPTPTVTPTPTPTPAQTATPAPSTSPTPSSMPVQTPSQSSEPTPPVEKPKPVVSLALRYGDGAGEAADILEGAEQRALFLFTPDELKQEDDLVRRLIARGHRIGLVLEGKKAEDCLAQLTRGRQLMADIARAAVLVVSAEDLSRSGVNEVRNAGCAIWDATLYADGLTRSGVLTRLDDDRVNRVEITCDAAGTELLAELLPVLTGEDYRLRPASPAALSN